METKHKNALIGALLAVVFVMAVGYAAFAQQLTINGSASIASDWNVKITKIEATGHTGTGADAGSDQTKVSGDGLSADFVANLQSPGDSVTYTVTVANQGSIDAELSTATWTPETPTQVSATPEEALLHPIYYADTASDLIGDELSASGTQTFTVTVTYNSNVASQPDEGVKTANGTLNLSYVQYGA